MHCQTCGAAFRGRGQHCAECKKTLSGLSTPTPPPKPQADSENRFPNDQPFNAPAYRKPLSKEGGWERPTLVRTNIIPMALGGRHVQQNWVFGVGAAASALMLANIVFRWGIFWFWLLVPALVVCYMGHRLIRKRFVRFADLFNFESDNAGHVFLTTLGGDCPVCQSEIKVKDIGPKKFSETVIQCTADKTHRWVFNPDNLDRL